MGTNQEWTVSISQMPLRTKVLVMAGVMLSMFTAAMDQTVMSTAMPRVVAQLGGLSLYSWAFTAFMLTSTTVVPIVGKLSDIFGRKPFYMVGIVVFLAGSVLSGTSQAMIQLILFRALQGVGAGILFSTSFAIIADVFRPEERGRWMGLMSSTFAMASVVGPFLGGYITDNLSWRWVFYINLPVGMLALAVVYHGMPWIRAGSVKKQIDYAGTAAMIATVVPLLLALGWAGNQYAWGSPRIIGLLLWSTAMALVFLWVERRAPEPILPIFLFKNRIFAVSIGVTFLTAMAMFGAISFMPLFIQGVIGFSATRSGVVTIPMSLSISVAAAISGQIISRTMRYRILGIAGVAIATVGMVYLSRLSVDSTYGQAVVAMVVLGFGLGVSFPLYTLAVQNALPFPLLGVVTSSIQFFRSVGGTIGVAVIGSLVIGRLAGEIAKQTPAEVVSTVPPHLLAPLEKPQILLDPQALAQVQQGFLALGERGPALFDQTLTAVRTALAISISEAFIIGVALSVLAVIITTFLKEAPIRGGLVAASRAGRSGPQGDTEGVGDPAPHPIEDSGETTV